MCVYLVSSSSFRLLKSPFCSCANVFVARQGATCYMNSLLQQLYHIPHFRTGILGTPHTSPKTHKHSLTNLSISSAVVVCGSVLSSSPHLCFAI